MIVTENGQGQCLALPILVAGAWYPLPTPGLSPQVVCWLLPSTAVPGHCWRVSWTKSPHSSHLTVLMLFFLSLWRIWSFFRRKTMTCWFCRGVFFTFYLEGMFFRRWRRVLPCNVLLLCCLVRKILYCKGHPHVDGKPMAIQITAMWVSRADFIPRFHSLCVVFNDPLHVNASRGGCNHRVCVDLDAHELPVLRESFPKAKLCSVASIALRHFYLYSCACDFLQLSSFQRWSSLRC